MKTIQFLTILLPYKKLIFISFFISVFTQSSFVFANKLDLLQSQIQLKEQQITGQKQQKKILEKKLQQQEQEIKKLTSNLNNIQQQINLFEHKIKLAEQHQQQLIKQEKEKNLQLNQLAKQIYNMENTSFVKQVLSEHDPKNIRIKQFLRKLYRNKNQLIEELNITKQQLKQEKINIKDQLNEQQHKLKQQQEQQQQLQSKQQERLVTLNKLKEQLTIEQAELDKLRKNEKELRQKIEQAKKQDQIISIKKKIKQTSKGLGKPHKQFKKPVDGKILHSFGSIQMGELRWKGIVIQAPQGTAVKAIADGRVILATHLQGYGLVVIIKHGENDLSLYGYNRTLAVKQGDIVAAGDRIATVGQVQGKTYSGTYFEISRKGNPINPIGWLK